MYIYYLVLETHAVDEGCSAARNDPLVHGRLDRVKRVLVPVRLGGGG